MLGWIPFGADGSCERRPDSILLRTRCFLHHCCEANYLNPQRLKTRPFSGPGGQPGHCPSPVVGLGAGMGGSSPPWSPSHDWHLAGAPGLGLLSTMWLLGLPHSGASKRVPHVSLLLHRARAEKSQETASATKYACFPLLIKAGTGPAQSWQFWEPLPPKSFTDHDFEYKH